MIHKITLWIQQWSAWIWLFFSLYGALLSTKLYVQARNRLKDLPSGRLDETTGFWKRHSLWFLVLHMSFVLVGVTSVLKLRGDWVSLLTLVVLLAVPVVLVYRSYDSLRVGGKGDTRGWLPF